MNRATPRTIDMTLAGEILPGPARPGWLARVFLGAAVLAVLAALVAMAALFLWLASLLLPVALVAGAVAYGAFRLQHWQGARVRP